MPGANYYYLREGERAGPISFDELKALADGGTIAPDEVVWQEGTPDWAPASMVAGLFPVEAIVAEAVADGAAARLADSIGESVAKSVSVAMAGSLAPPANDDFSRWVAGLEPRLRQFAGRMQVDRVTVLAVAAGAAALGILLLATLLKWNQASLADGFLPTYHRGIHALEGKFIVLLVLSSAGLLAVSLALIRLLPIGILYAGAASTCAFLLLVAWRINVPGIVAEYIAVGGSGGATLGLYFAALLAMGAAAAFIVAALRTPLKLTQFERAGGGPLVQRFGALAICQLAAFLIGMGFVVARL